MLSKIEAHKVLDFSSRKYRSAWYLTIIFLALLVIPEVISFILYLCWGPVSFTILPVDAFITVISLIWAAYFGANVVEHHKSFQPKKQDLSLLDEIVEDEGDDAGGQPEESIGNEP